MLASGTISARTTASEVVDGATPKAFVDGAATDIAAITNINEGAKIPLGGHRTSPMAPGQSPSSRA
ncbi:MAG: hypothetical protein F4Y60_09710 [Boseongicola sp. SB0664_bin_43]|uniref:Uncharacterized protein n=1 Tax=Boseongicola sp. SB0664_bin_43 TaxID=2604844 RepID=A0A6B0Y5E6_9RHOB|nr:hypothetical protein [Boseongicola sp. SB0664_bin_43]MYK31020.1 hypothetical protein [Boseongicola sp. SB0670_bin_30]